MGGVQAHESSIAPFPSGGGGPPRPRPHAASSASHCCVHSPNAARACRRGRASAAEGQRCTAGALLSAPVRCDRIVPTSSERIGSALCGLWYGLGARRSPSRRIGAEALRAPHRPPHSRADPMEASRATCNASLQWHRHSLRTAESNGRIGRAVFAFVAAVGCQLHASCCACWRSLLCVSTVACLGGSIPFLQVAPQNA